MKGLPTTFGSWTPTTTITGDFIIKTKPPVVSPGQAGIPVNSHSGVPQTEPKKGHRVVSAAQQQYRAAFQAAIDAYLDAAHYIDSYNYLTIAGIFHDFSNELNQVVAQADWLTVDGAITSAWTTLTTNVATLDGQGYWIINVPNTQNVIKNYNTLLAALQVAETRFWTYWIDDIEIVND